MYTVWHVDKYKITFKLVINHWTNEILQHIVVSSGFSRPGVIDARARYRAAAWGLSNTDLECAHTSPARPSNKNIIKSNNYPAGYSFLIHAALTQNTETHYLISYVNLTNMYGVNMCVKGMSKYWG